MSFDYMQETIMRTHRLLFPIKYHRPPGVRSFVCICVIGVMMSVCSVLAQGFDWEYSARLPRYSMPLYAGISTEYSNNGTTTDLQILDIARAEYPEVICTKFTSGSGSSYRIAACGEYWQNPIIAFGARAGYSHREVVFMASSPRALMFDGNFLQTRYELSTNVHALCVEPYIKIVLPSIHAWAGGGLRTEYSIGTESRLREVVVEPRGYVFPGTTSQERLLSTRDRAGMRGFIVNPFVSVGMDFDAGMGKYVSTSIVVGLPVYSFAQWASWKTLSLGMQLSYVFNIVADKK